MILRKLCLLTVLCCVVVVNGRDKTKPEDPAAKWGKTIAEFEDWDRKNSFPSDAVLFVGSSSINGLLPKSFLQNRCHVVQYGP
jgi:hypothetical protein